MRKIFCLILLAGLLAFGSTAFAAEKYKLPDGSRATLGGGRIYLMYDLETRALCYITSLGGISCSHRGKFAIPNRLNEMMNKAIDEYKERNKTAPHMILIDIKPEGGIESEKDRDL